MNTIFVRFFDARRCCEEILTYLCKFHRQTAQSSETTGLKKDGKKKKKERFFSTGILAKIGKRFDLACADARVRNWFALESHECQGTRTIMRSELSMPGSVKAWC
jgi:hypothetical protein